MTELKQQRAIRIGLIGLILTVLVTLVSLQFDKLPILSNNGLRYDAVFDDASGLTVNDDVLAAGVKIGSVSAIAVDTGYARVSITIASRVRLGDRTTAAIKTTSLLGRRSVELGPAGTGRMREGSTIPRERTRSGYSLPSLLNDLTTTVRDVDLDQLTRSMDTASDVLAASAPAIRPALDGMKRISETVSRRDEALRSLLSNAEQVSAALAQRGPQLNSLLVDGNALLGALADRVQVIGQLITNISEVSRQLSGLVHDNEAQLGPALDKLGRVVAVLQKNNQNLGEGIEGLSTYIGTLGDAVASGPYFYSYIQNLVPAQYTQPILNAVLGLPPAPLPIPGVR